MAVLNTAYYSSHNESLYSDGTEEEIFRRFSDGDSTVSAEDPWSILYHCSPARENILNWYPFREGCSVLELGAGLGALTGLFLRRAKRVVACELTLNRARTIMQRYSDADNLEVIPADFHLLPREEKFDYVVLNGVLEYAALTGEGKDVYADFLRTAASHLKADGCILLSIENRLGLKYFAGAPEDHAGTLFEGLNEYPGHGGVQTFDLRELSEICTAAGLHITRRYYPYPDYKFPTEIFTDRSINRREPETRDLPMDRDRFSIFDEERVMKSLIRAGTMQNFSNSFLFELRLVEGSASNGIDYVKISAARGREKAVYTYLNYQDGIAVKKPIYPEGEKHLQSLAESAWDRGILHNQTTELRDGALVSGLLSEESLYDALLRSLSEGDEDRFWQLLDRLKSNLYSGSFARQKQDERFRAVFGESEAAGYLHWLPNANIDLTARNIFFTGDTWTVIDCEWTFDFPIPAEYVLWRSLSLLSLEEPFCVFLPHDRKLAFIQISEREEDLFLEWEQSFLASAVGSTEKTNYTLFRKNLIPVRIEELYERATTECDQLRKETYELRQQSESTTALLTEQRDALAREKEEKDRLLQEKIAEASVKSALAVELEKLNGEKEEKLIYQSGEISRLAAENVRLDEELTKIRSSCSESDARLKLAEDSLSGKERELSEKTHAMKTMEERVNALEKDKQQLALELQSARSQYTAVIDSTTWKLTYPLRKLMDLILRRGVRKELPASAPVMELAENAVSPQPFPEKTCQRTPSLQRILVNPPRRGPVLRHTESVDIIICVHNALEDVKRCIESVYEFTTFPYSVILIDDGSSEPTASYLRSVAESLPNVQLKRSETGRGYTIAANEGLHLSTADYMVLLNSDTIVTPGWIDKMIECAKSDPAIGIVGPLSNTASWQSVPELFDDDGDWAHNPLPEGVTAEQYGNWVEKYSARIYPQFPLLNGFCLMISRETVRKNGYLDEETFGRGFGEEDDYNLRAYKAGIRLAVADDTFIFHAQSKSYTDSKRLELCEVSGRNVRRKHGDELVDRSVEAVRYSPIFDGIRARCRVAPERESAVAEAKHRWEGKRILFLLPVADAGGGGNVIIQEIIAMRQMGVDAAIWNRLELKPYFEKSYPNLSVPVLYSEDGEPLDPVVRGFDVVCATLYSSVYMCRFETLSNPPKVAYYVQDYEPYFFEPWSTEYRRAYDSYSALPNMTLVTKTEWNAREVWDKNRVACEIIGPSVNIDLFRPSSERWDKEQVTVLAMVRPESPRRAPELTMSVLREISLRYGERVKIIIFGADMENNPNDAAFFNSVQTDFPFFFAGKLSPQEVAELLGKGDIFADFSTFQAMGLTAMEAMACGCAVIVPANGGTGAYAEDRENALIVNTEDRNECVSALSELVENDQLRRELAERAMKDVCRFAPEFCAYRFLKAVFGEDKK